jgi:hypothetical protein
MESTNGISGNVARSEESEVILLKSNCDLQEGLKDKERLSECGEGGTILGRGE